MKPVLKVKLTPVAEADLESIWQFSREKWGVHQAEAYLGGLFDIFDLLAMNPEMSPVYTEFTPAVRIHQHSSHLVIYKESQTKLLIVRILHKSVLLSNYL